MNYGRGPTRRLAPPTEVAPRTVTPRTVSPAPSKTARTPSARTGKEISPSESWRTLKRTNPDKAKEIVTTTTVTGRLHNAGVRTAVGAVGGVYPSPNRGSGSQSGHHPWGFDCDNSSWSFGLSFGSCSPCSWWWWPCYWTWYYPCWWWWWGPSYCAGYGYYPYYPYYAYYPSPVYTTTVVYPEESTQVVYAQQEPVGEASVNNGQVPQAMSALSIAAQRYLELGDRAFREGRYTDAVQFYAKAVEFAPDQGALYLVLADALFAAGDYHYGAYAVRRALELDPGLVETSVDKHGFYPQPAIFDQHLATLERYLADHPTDRDARLVLALNYLFGGRAPDAARTLEAAGTALDEDAAAQKILVRARSLPK